MRAVLICHLVIGTLIQVATVSPVPQGREHASRVPQGRGHASRVPQGRGHTSQDSVTSGFQAPSIIPVYYNPLQVGLTRQSQGFGINPEIWGVPVVYQGANPVVYPGFNQWTNPVFYPGITQGFPRVFQVNYPADSRHDTSGQPQRPRISTRRPGPTRKPEHSPHTDGSKRLVCKKYEKYFDYCVEIEQP